MFIPMCHSVTLFTILAKCWHVGYMLELVLLVAPNYMIQNIIENISVEAILGSISEFLQNLNLICLDGV